PLCRWATDLAATPLSRYDPLLKPPYAGLIPTARRNGGGRMEHILGIGGVFFKARDPKALAAWYREHLGVPVEASQTYGALKSTAAGEQTVWSTFPADTKYFGTGPAPFMINYRVRNLEAMLAQLRAAGVQVDHKVEDYDYGRFGWAIDPEGNRLELWEPR